MPKLALHFFLLFIDITSSIIYICANNTYFNIYLFMKIKLINAVFVLYLIGILSTCDHGIGPKESLQGFSGTIYFENWPPQNTLIDLRLVVF